MVRRCVRGFGEASPFQVRQDLEERLRDLNSVRQMCVCVCDVHRDMLGMVIRIHISLYLCVEGLESERSFVVESGRSLVCVANVKISLCACMRHTGIDIGMRTSPSVSLSLLS